jgi:hypothetical protein
MTANRTHHSNTPIWPQRKRRTCGAWWLPVTRFFLCLPLTLIACVSSFPGEELPTTVEPMEQPAPEGAQPIPVLSGISPETDHPIFLVPRGAHLNIPRDTFTPGTLPPPGQCVRLDEDGSSHTTGKPTAADRHGSNVQLNPANESPVFIVDRASGAVHSMALPDDLGAFTCESLPASRNFYMANGVTFSELEQEDTDELIILSTAESGELKVSGTDLSGWLLRIGPVAPRSAESSRIGSEIEQPHDQQGSQSTHLELPEKLNTASPIESSTYGLEATHAFNHSFIFRDSEPHLELPAGRFTLVFIRPLDYSMCVLHVDIQSGQQARAQCPPQTKSAGPAQIAPSTAIMVPQSDLESSSIARTNADLLGTALVGFSGSAPSLTLYPEGQDEWDLDGLVFDFSPEIMRQRPHIEGYLADGQIPSLVVAPSALEKGVPLLVQTRMWRPALRTSRLNSEDLLSQVTNGALIQWTSPVPEGSLTELSGDGSLSFRVDLPPYDLTKYIEVYLNAKLFKRYVVGDRKAEEPMTLTFEERVKSDVDFLVTIFTWGKGYLPELIYGQRFLRPRAIHSKICFDMNRNQICDNLNEEGIPSNGINPLD